MSRACSLRALALTDGGLVVRTSTAVFAAISGFMKLLTRFITDAYKRHHEVQGSLWQERFHVWPVRAGQTELAVMRYIDRLPVREELARSVQLYPFSSYVERKNDLDGSRMDYPDVFLQQKPTHKDCLTEYSEFVKGGPNQHDVNMIETTMQHDESTIGEGDHGSSPEKLPDKMVDRKPRDDLDGSDDLQYE